MICRRQWGASDFRRETELTDFSHGQKEHQTDLTLPFHKWVGLIGTGASHSQLARPLCFCMLQFQALGSSPGITRLSSPLEFGKVMVGIFGMSTRQIPWERSPQFVASMQEHILHHALLVDCHTLFSRHMLCTQCAIFSPLPLRFVTIG